MAKQVVIAGMEELFGEYILNMSKENLKIAALRGRVKLEDVQLDGDMIGSHVLNAVGLQSTSFGVLSCSVQSVNVIIPWNKLEQEVSKMVLEGIHMVCVPLVPLTAHNQYGAGTKMDPQCTLRTRSKRLLLSRLERNFWNGQYAEEGGPPMKRVQRAVDEVKRDLLKKKQQPQQSAASSSQQQQQQQQQGQTTHAEGVEESQHHHHLVAAATAEDGGSIGNNNKDSYEEWLFQTTDGNDLPELPRDWKVKIREKMMRNMEASMHNVHIRVEVPERGLDFNHHDALKRNNTNNNNSEEATRNSDVDGVVEESKQELLPEERAFCFGFALESLVVRTANEDWKAGSHDTANRLDGSHMSSVKGNLGPNPYVVKNNKIGFFSKLSMYWDQGPPLLLAETDLMRGCRSMQKQKITPDKWRSRMAAAMEALSEQQEPGPLIRQSLGALPPSATMAMGNGEDSKSLSGSSISCVPHVYVCKDLNAEIRVRASDRTSPGPISCSADVMPFSWDFSLRPHQYKQYNLLRAAIQRQQRFDTMLRQRPQETPLDNPRAWWQYAIACVTARPTSRPWKDVQVICQNRARYMELVQRKNRHRISGNSICASGSNSFHAGLSDAESEELLSLEELLPLEALQTFHLIALRQLYQSKRHCHQQQQPQHHNQDQPMTKEKRRPRGLGRFRFLSKKKHRRRSSRGSASEFTLGSIEDDIGSSTIANNSSFSEEGDEDDSLKHQYRGEQTTETSKLDSPSPRRRRSSSHQQQQQQQRPLSLMKAMTLRLGNKIWYVDWRFHDISLNVSMLVNNIHLGCLQLKARANARAFGKGKRDLCFDVTQCDIIHGDQRILYVKSNDDGDVLTELDEPQQQQQFPYKISCPDESELSMSSVSRSQVEETTSGTGLSSGRHHSNHHDHHHHPYKAHHPHGGVPTIRSLLRDISGPTTATTIATAATTRAQGDKPDLKVASTFLDLPPPGVVCRIVAGMNASTHKVSISSHPAMFLWTTTFMDGLQRFQETNPDLGQHMRNAATPLARKAQLALIQPGSRAIHLNIMAPKIWIPISSSSFSSSSSSHNNNDEQQEGGTLVLDAGAVRLKGEKEEGETDMTVHFSANDFQANFVRSSINSTVCRGFGGAGAGLFFPSHHYNYNPPGSTSGDFLLWGQSTTAVDTAVIRPFNVTVHAHTHTKSATTTTAAAAVTTLKPSSLEAAAASQQHRVPMRSTEIRISPICLNLVDAEVLARAMGKWYARSVARVSRRRENRRENNSPDHRNNGYHYHSGSGGVGGMGTGLFLPVVDRTQHLSVEVEKIEIAIEGHSKAHRNEDCDRSMASSDSLHDSSPPIRTYLVEVDLIQVNRTSHGLTATTRLSTQNASIFRLRDGASYAPLRKRRDPVDSQYRILVRSSMEEPQQPEQHAAGAAGAGAMMQQPVLRAAFFHDGKNHLDEVEVDIDSVVLRVTTTTLKDCVKAFRRVAEVVQLATREMERKVHEEGRKARQRDSVLGGGGGARDENIDNLVSYDHNSYLGGGGGDRGGDRPQSTLTVMPPEMSRGEKARQASPKAPSDSSILLRVTLNESTLLAGRPTGAIFGSPVQRHNRPSFAVIQVLSSALVMFQSIENFDGTGNETLHVSIDNASSLVNTEFERVSPAEVPPMIGPTGAEFRVVYTTENLGCVVSQDVSLDCEALKICLTPNDLTIMSSISRSMVDRLREISGPEQQQQHDTSTSSPCDANKSSVHRSPRDGSMRSFASLLRYQKKGSGIATVMRVEVLSVSFVLLKAYKSYLGSPEFLDFCLSDLKGNFDGCMSALSGEVSAQLSINFFNTDASVWEYAMEPVGISIEVDQMPNELLLHLKGANMIQLNLTGVFLREFADMKFDFKQDRSGVRGSKPYDVGLTLNPSMLSTVGLRRATEAPSVKVQNMAGFDIHLVPDSKPFSPESGLIPNGHTCTVEALPTNPLSALENELSFSLRVASSAIDEIGERESVFDLPVRPTSCQEARLYLLRPVSMLQSVVAQRSEETVFTNEEDSSIGPGLSFCAEPVVESCMHNQRLSAFASDVYSIPKGCDLLSGGVWSPADDVHTEAPGCLAGEHVPESPSTKAPVSSPRSPGREGVVRNSYWLKPYQSDTYEWTDMTCTVRMAPERVMLPDSHWMWANDWTVDVSGKLGESTDADGWEYQTDFESFTRAKRDYQRGDICRRRRWTRTRMVKPPKLDDPNRLLRFVWDPATDKHGNVCVVIRSHLRIHNSTAGALSFYLCGPSWPEDMPVGTVGSGQRINVPVTLASATYMKIGRARSGGSSFQDDDSGRSDQVMILPTSPTSSKYVRTSMDLGDVSGTVLHFLVEIQSRRGIVDIIVEPVLRILNLLPCQFECQVGEMLQKSDTRNPDVKPTIGLKGRPITMTERMSIECGKEGVFTAVNPWRKPHVSFRVPGYKWSLWQRIINRKSSSETWRPSEDEEDWHFLPRSDADFADEYKSVVHFERWTKSGDPLLVIMSVECGHCPTVRLYSQFWILDKSGFGCHFAEGFEDILSTVPDKETSRRTHLLPSDGRDSMIRKDMNTPGYQWSIGVNGMSLYFSKREKLAFSIEKLSSNNEKEVKGSDSKHKGGPRSKWVNPLDISNVMPKTIVSVDEHGGTRCFELAISVNVCPGIFTRSRLITIVPRYQIVNLLHRELVVAQDGCLDASVVIPSQSTMPFHWEKGGFARKVRLGTPFKGNSSKKESRNRWSNGLVRLDRVGISSLRIPSDTNLTKVPMVVEMEVRLASKEQPSALVVVVWSANEKMHHPLYSLRNTTPYTVLCRQPLQEEKGDSDYQGEASLVPEACSSEKSTLFHCGHPDVGPMILSLLGLDRIEEFVWIVRSGDVVCFGFDDPEKPHILEWTCVDNDSLQFDDNCPKAFLEVDAMGSTSTLALSRGRHVKCHIGAEHSTKVIEFAEVVPSSPTNGTLPILSSLKTRGAKYQEMLKTQGVILEREQSVSDEDDDVGICLRMDLAGLSVSIVDNSNKTAHGREILVAEFDRLSMSVSQTREGYHEFELRLVSFQVDNHVHKSIHPVLIFCPPLHENEPHLHMSAVRRLQLHNNTYVFRYAAIRLLEVDIFLDRRTAETIAKFIEPLTIPRETEHDEPTIWARKLTEDMESNRCVPRRLLPGGMESTLHSANAGRIYFEQLHLHPVRLSLTFTQEWMEWDAGAESVMLFQFIRGMASIAKAPLTFTSFVVSHVFESPIALGRVIATHYSSQLTKQIFGILGSLAILTAPADFITNVGTGVRDFFYEPINGAVHGPKQFIEGLEAGTQSLARGVFVGVVRGAANVTELVSANLVGLTADEDFIDERKAHQRLLTDAQSRGTATRTFGDSLYLAGASVARSFRSGALGIVEQPAMYASKHGPVGFLKGVGKALLGAVVKPVVGVGDAAVLVMNHMSDATSRTQVLPKIPKRLRRALPSQSPQKPNCVRLIAYDERAAKAQKIVTGGESLDDVYYGHLQIPSHLIIASHQCLWAIDRRSREPWCANWEEVSHFSRVEGGVRVVVFSKTGLKSYTFHVTTKEEASELYNLLAMHSEKMGNSSELNSALLSTKSESLSRHQIPGVKGRQVNHIFGSCNVERSRPEATIKDEIDIVEQCFARVRRMSSDSATYFRTLDEEAWSLITNWGLFFSGLSSKRCLVAGVINATGGPIQIKSAILLEGGSPCYTIPTTEYDTVQGVLHTGGCVLFFGWGVAPNLVQDGNVFMSLESNSFTSNLASFKNSDTFAEAMPGYQVGFLEKSVDDSGWWAKYWIIVRRQP